LAENPLGFDYGSFLAICVTAARGRVLAMFESLELFVTVLPKRELQVRVGGGGRSGFLGWPSKRLVDTLIRWTE
jgi:hypothetical protein